MESNIKPLSQKEIISLVRDQLSHSIDFIESLAKDRPIKNGAEITLALRKAQEARMWLGVALALANNQDPFKHKQEGEGGK